MVGGAEGKAILGGDVGSPESDMLVVAVATWGLDTIVVDGWGPEYSGTPTNPSDCMSGAPPPLIPEGGWTVGAEVTLWPMASVPLVAAETFACPSDGFDDLTTVTGAGTSDSGWAMEG